MSVFLLCENVASTARHPVESELLATIPGLVEVSTLNALLDGTSDQGGAEPFDRSDGGAKRGPKLF